MTESQLEGQQRNLSSRGVTWWHRRRFQELERFIESNPQIRRCVDIGAGSGLLGDYLRERLPDIEYLWSESSEILSALLTQKFPTSSRVTNLSQFSTSDVIAVLDVLEHVEDDWDFMNKLAQQSAIGSHLVVTVPLGKRFFSDWDTRLGHYRRYQKAEIVDLLRNSGYRPVSSRYLFPELIPLLVLRVVSHRNVRRVSRSGSEIGNQSAEFPNLPEWLDRLLLLMSTAINRLSRMIPLGSSLVVYAERRR